MIAKLLASTWVALAIMPMIVAAEEAQIEELQKKLEQRDKVILELLRRVEALEQRTGISSGQQADVSERENEVEDQEPSGSPSPDVDGEVARPQGRKIAPGEIIVDEAAAERALERSLTQAGALLLRPGRIEVEPSISYARNEDAAPIFVSSGGSTFSGELERNADSLTFDLSMRLGLPWDSQFEIGFPYRWRNVETVTSVGSSPLGTSNQTGAGAGDLRLGVAKTLLRESIWRPDLIARVTWDTDTGQESDDGVSLRGGSNEVRTSLIAIKRQDPVVFLGGISYEHAFEEDGVQPGDTVSLDLGGFIALSPETSLRLQLSSAYQQETEVFGSAVDGSDRVISVFVIGGSTILSRNVLLNLSTGIGLTDDADDFSITLSMPIRFDSLLY